MAWAKFKRIGDSSSIDNIDFEDGAFIVTGDGKSYIDYDDDRILISSGIGEALPVGCEIDYDGDNVPSGWERIENKEKILWTNPNPTVSFPAQTVTLNESLDNYDMYEILVLQSTTNARLMSTGKIPVGHGTIISYNTSSYLFRPTGEVVSGSTISFEDGRAVAGGTVSIDNGVIMPMYVIGYKTGLFS